MGSATLMVLHKGRLLVMGRRTVMQVASEAMLYAKPELGFLRPPAAASRQSRTKSKQHL